MRNRNKKIIFRNMCSRYFYSIVSVKEPVDFVFGFRMNSVVPLTWLSSSQFEPKMSCRAVRLCRLPLAEILTDLGADEPNP